MVISGLFLFFLMTIFTVTDFPGLFFKTVLCSPWMEKPLTHLVHNIFKYNSLIFPHFLPLTIIHMQLLMDFIHENSKPLPGRVSH